MAEKNIFQAGKNNPTSSQRFTPVSRSKKTSANIQQPISQSIPESPGTPQNTVSEPSLQDNYSNQKTISNSPKQSNYDKELKKIKKQRKRLIIIILLVLLLAGGAAAWYFLIGFPVKQPSYTEPVDDTRMMLGSDVMDGVYTKGMTTEEIEAAMQAVADKDNFTLQIGTEMRFENGKSPGVIEIVNPKNNIYPLSVQIKLADGRTVYESGAVKPGQYIAQGKLLINLPAGEYPAIGMVTIYSEDGKKVQANTVVEMNIIVQN